MGLSLLLVSCAALLLQSCSIQSSPILAPATPRQQVVIFDIDSTLTPNNLSIFTAREQAADAVQHFAALGYKIVYLSARNRFFQFNIPNFLNQNKFPAGDIQVAESSAQLQDYTAFKYAVIKRYQDAGWTIHAAFGDASSDFAAYSKAGMAKEQIYAVLPEDQAQCRSGDWGVCILSWREFLQADAKAPEQSQP